jgi:glutamine amidotransferase
MKVGIIDYGVGNLGSVARALEEIGAIPVIVSEPNKICCVEKLILPGVGNFFDCASRLETQGWTLALEDEVAAKEKPILGICLGMQLLASHSTEGADARLGTQVKGLDLIPGKVVNLRDLNCQMRIPHVGWNSINIAPLNNQMFSGIPSDTDFYFVHSYAFLPTDQLHVIATVNYGIHVTAAVIRKNVWGTQFHPEKSSRAGFRLLRNFIENSSC